MSCGALGSDARYVNRYRTAPTTHPRLQEFATFLHAKFEEWASIIEVSQPKLRDQMASQPAADKKATIAAIRKTINLMVETVAQGLPQADAAPQHALVQGSSLGVIAAIHREYDGPGHLSKDGPRHDNGETDRMNDADFKITPISARSASPLRRGRWSPRVTRTCQPTFPVPATTFRTTAWRRCKSGSRLF